MAKRILKGAEGRYPYRDCDTGQVSRVHFLGLLRSASKDRPVAIFGGQDVVVYGPTMDTRRFWSRILAIYDDVVY